MAVMVRSISAETSFFDGIAPFVPGGLPLAVVWQLHEEGRDTVVGHAGGHVARQREIGSQDVQDDHARPARAEADRGKILGMDGVILGVRRFDGRWKTQL